MSKNDNDNLAAIPAKAPYEPPRLTVRQFAVERGFAESSTTPASPFIDLRLSQDASYESFDNASSWDLGTYHQTSNESMGTTDWGTF